MPFLELVILVIFAHVVVSFPLSSLSSKSLSLASLSFSSSLTSLSLSFPPGDFSPFSFSLLVPLGSSLNALDHPALASNSRAALSIIVKQYNSITASLTGPHSTLEPARPSPMKGSVQDLFAESEIAENPGTAPPDILCQTQRSPDSAPDVPINDTSPHDKFLEGPRKTSHKSQGISHLVQKPLEIACNIIQQVRSFGAMFSKRKVFTGVPHRDTLNCQGHSTPTLPVYYSVPSQGQLVQLAVLTW